MGAQWLRWLGVRGERQVTDDSEGSGEGADSSEGPVKEFGPRAREQRGATRLDHGLADFNLDEAEGRKFIRPAKPDSRIDKWIRWLDRIEPEVVDEIATNRALFREVSEVLDANPEIPGSDFFAYWAGNYGRSQAVAVRRQTDISGQSITLGRLLVEIRANRQLLTRERYVGMYEWGHQSRGDGDFDAFAYLDPENHQPDETGNELSERRIGDDIERLNNSADVIRHHVDRVIAHADQRPPPYSPTFADLDEAIDVILELVMRYSQLLTGKGYVTLEATPQFDRLAPFRVAWIEPPS
jgi:hypothetical protein